jgi:hypothetical protein
MDELLYAEESYAIRGAVFEVYREVGCGFLEPVYQECLEKEFKRAIASVLFRVFRGSRSFNHGKPGKARKRKSSSMPYGNTRSAKRFWRFSRCGLELDGVVRQMAQRLV